MTTAPPSIEAVRVTVDGTQQQAPTATTSEAPFLVYTSQGGTPYLMSRRDLLGPTAEDEEAFHELAAQWRSETGHLSIASEKANNFAYHQIMGMGEKALPLIFRELQTKASDWFWALRAIARDRAPTIPDEDKGRVRRMADKWIEWGETNGYIRS